MTDSEKLRLETMKTAVLKAAIEWRNAEWNSKECDRAERKLCEAVDHYEDALYAIEHKTEECHAS